MKKLAPLVLGAMSSVLVAQDSNVTVPNSVLQTVAELLPERSSAGAQYLADEFDPNLVVTEDCNVEITFIWDGAGFQNTLGYFTYQVNPDGSKSILTSDLLIPNASFPPQGTAQIGDVYSLRDIGGGVRTFSAGERIGFFVIADGWRREPDVQSWNPLFPTAPSNNPLTNRFTGRGCYTTIPEFNPEMLRRKPQAAKHCAMIGLPGVAGFNDGDDFYLVGFEDLNRARRADNDFNDLVFVVSANPPTAIAGTNVMSFVSGDLDGDGIEGVDDQFPQDGTRAFVTEYPTNGSRLIGVEDRYPLLGDADYNDVVFAYRYHMVSNADGDVVDLMGTYDLVARGAAYDHKVGVHIPGIPDSTTGTIEIERRYGEDIVENVSRTMTEFIAAGERLDDLIPSTTTMLPPVPGRNVTNTTIASVEREAGSVRFKMHFDQPIDPAALGTMPFDFYVGVFRGQDVYDVHFPGWDGFNGRPEFLPEESGESAFIDDLGYPWIIELPTEWKFVLERNPIWSAYPEFSTWVTSGSVLSRDWYRYPSEDTSLYSLDISEYISVKDWSFDIRD